MIIGADMTTGQIGVNQSRPQSPRMDIHHFLSLDIRRILNHPRWTIHNPPLHKTQKYQTFRKEWLVKGANG